MIKRAKNKSLKVLRNWFIAIKDMDSTNNLFARKFYLENFVYDMNSMAKDLVMKNTKFFNPHGLDDPESYSTIKDLAILLTAAYYDKQCL